MLAAAAASASILFLLRLLKKRKQKKQLPPGTTGNLLLGELLEYTADTHAFFEKRLAKYGGTFLTNLFFKDTIVLKPTTANLKIMSSQPNLGWPRHFLDVIGQNALAMVNGAVHKRQRALSGRAFNAKMLDTYLPSFQSLTRQHLDKWAMNDEPKDMREDIKFYTFELAQRVLLGVELPESQSREMMDLMATTIEGLAVMFPINLPGFYYRKVMLARRDLVASYQKTIDQKRMHPAKTPCSMIDYVLAGDSKAEPISDVELQDFCVNMSFAGHDTTLATMQSLIYYLSLHPQLVNELRSEVDQAWDGVAPLTREVLQKAVKCEAFTMEVMRLLPPVPFMARELSSTVTADGYQLPAGTTVMVGLKSVMDHHFLEQGQKIEELDLNRWFDSEGKYVGRMKLYEFASFSIFGAGGRMCIGYRFAMDELLVFMMTLLRGDRKSVV